MDDKLKYFNWLIDNNYSKESHQTVYNYLSQYKIHSDIFIPKGLSISNDYNKEFQQFLREKKLTRILNEGN